jgi:outer membrane lipoprotein-sorting protein
MNRFLRTAPTSRLLAALAGLLLAAGAGTAIAVAASGNGPVPPPRPLARAIHVALSAPPVRGISARISYTNHLIDASDLQGHADPLLSGATGRLWLSSDHRLRLELQSDNGDAEVLVNQRSFWVYDPSSNTVFEGRLPAHLMGGADTRGAAERDARHGDRAGIPSIAEIQRALTRVARHVSLSGAIPGDVAGRPTYTVRVSPRQSGGLLGGLALAWDAARGVPLRFGVYARGQQSPVLELSATDISYGAVPASDFAISPPSGAKVVNLSPAAAEHPGAGAGAGVRRHRHLVRASGVAAVAARLPFRLDAPAALAGRARQSVSLLDWGGHPAALITYGHGLDAVAVAEQAAPRASAQASGGAGDQPGLSLPTVSIRGATAQELDTALGTLIRFTRGGVSYTVVGSVAPSVAKLAARGL